MTEFDAKTYPRKLRTACLAVLLPLALAACGTAGGGTSLKNSASLAPVNEPTSAELTPAAAEKASQRVADAKSFDPGMTAKSKTLQKGQMSTAKLPIKTATLASAKAGQKPPYRKIRVNKSKTAVAAKKQMAKSALEPVTKGPTKKLVKLSKPASPKKLAIVKKPDVKALAKKVAKPVTRATIVKKVKAPAKPPAAQMVPMQVIPVQIAPQAASQDIADAFDEMKKEAQPEPGKIAEAKPAPVQHGFGGADHRFSGQ